MACGYDMAIIEVKTRVYDEQALLGGIDRKARLVPRLLAEERGWVPRQIARILVMPDITANRSVIGKHSATFGSALPARTPEVRAWLRRPSGALAGVWFLSLTTRAGGNRVAVGRRRVRVRSERAPGPRNGSITTVSGDQEFAAEGPHIPPP